MQVCETATLCVSPGLRKSETEKRNRWGVADVLRCCRRLASTPSKNDQTLTLAMPKPRVAAAAVLVVAPGTADERRVDLGALPLTIGSDADTHIRVSDPHVSRRHAEVRRTADGGYEACDTGSLNGTYLNRERIDSAVLANGDELQIGKFKLVFFQGAGGEEL